MIGQVLRFSTTEASALADQVDGTVIPLAMAREFGRPDHPEDLTAITTNIAQVQERIVAQLERESCVTIEDENDLPVLRRMLGQSRWFQQARPGNYMMSRLLAEKITMAEGN